MNEKKTDTADIEAVVRAEAERLGYRPGEFLDDHMAIALAALRGVRDARGDDEAELREKIADELAENDQCGVGPLSRQEYLDDAEAILSLIRTYGGTQAARSPQDDDDEAPTTYQDALAAACGTEADGPVRLPQGGDHEARIAQIIAPYTPSGWSNETRMADARKCAKDVLAYLSRYPPPERGPQLVCDECSRAFWTERDAAGHLTYTGNGPGGYSPCTGTVSCVARPPQSEDHDAGIEAASLVMHTLSCECDTPAQVQDCPYNGISEWEQRAVRSIVSAYLSRVAPSPQGEDVLVNDEKTVLVNIWSTGEVEVAFRDDPCAMWGPPIRVVGDA